MIFNGINNQIVELVITNYQNLGSRDKDWDDNWLNIYLRIKSDVGNWQVIDSSLTAWEFQNLIDWFHDLSKDKQPQWTDMEFTEPNISFYLLNNFSDDIKIIKIKFDLECKPKSTKDNVEYFVIINADKNELRRITE